MVSTQEEDYVDDTHFHKSLQELRDFSSQLYHTAEYCEATFLAAEDSSIIVENMKQCVSRAIVTTVEHLGSISANLESSLSKSTTINPETNRKIDSLKMRIEKCQQSSHKLAIHKFYLAPDFSRHHCRYILPPSTGPASINDVSRDSKDGMDGKKDELETEEPLFLHTHHNCKSSLSLVDNSTNNDFSPPVMPVRGDAWPIYIAKIRAICVPVQGCSKAEAQRHKKERCRLPTEPINGWIYDITARE